MAGGVLPCMYAMVGMGIGMDIGMGIGNSKAHLS